MLGREILRATAGSRADPQGTFWINGSAGSMQGPAGSWGSLVVAVSVQPGISLTLFLGVHLQDFLDLWGSYLCP